MPILHTFDSDLHICRDMQGRFIPSVSQINECQSLSFPFRKMVERGIMDGDMLDRRSRIGTEVHNLTDIYDQYKDIDPSFLSMETHGYVESYIGFLNMSGFVPQKWSWRLCEEINGLPLTGEIDKYGMLGKYPAIIDLKTGSTKSDSWGFQLAPYEFLMYRSAKIGRVIRAVAHLQPDGSPGKLIEFGDTSPIDGVHYGDTFLAALHTAHAALRRGHLSEQDFMDAD